MSKIDGSDSKNPLYCSFCGKSQHEVRKLIAGRARKPWSHFWEPAISLGKGA
jgi:ClpX C4-type zinc finger protein